MKCPNCDSDVDVFLARCTRCGETDIWRNSALKRLGRDKDVKVVARPVELVDQYELAQQGTPADLAPTAAYVLPQNLASVVKSPEFPQAIHADTLSLGDPAFIKLVQSGAAPKVSKALAEDPALANTRDDAYLSMLHLAVNKGNEKIVTALLDAGAEINIGDPNGDTPLHLAVEKGATKLVSLLVSRGAEVNIHDTVGRSALYVAIMKKSVALADFLLKNGTDVTTPDPDALTPLHFAADNGQAKIVTLILNQPGVDVDAADTQGATALFHAARQGYKDVVTALLAGGANVNAVDYYAQTPLHWAARVGASTVVPLLIKAGADVNKAGSGNTTPLHCAAAEGKKEVVEMLLKSGAEVNPLNIGGETPLALATQNEHKTVIALLQKKGGVLELVPKEPVVAEAEPAPGETSPIEPSEIPAALAVTTVHAPHILDDHNFSALDGVPEAPVIEEVPTAEEPLEFLTPAPFELDEEEPAAPADIADAEEEDGEEKSK